VLPGDTLFPFTVATADGGMFEYTHGTPLVVLAIAMELPFHQAMGA
jgi:hypothetical protein